MSNVLRLCRKCGAEIFADAPEALCTACLFETGLNLLAGESVAEVVGLGHHAGLGSRYFRVRPLYWNLVSQGRALARP